MFAYLTKNYNSKCPVRVQDKTLMNDHVKKEPIDNKFCSKEINNSMEFVHSNSMNKSQICVFCEEKTQAYKKCNFAPEAMKKCQICVFNLEETHEVHKKNSIQRQISPMYDSQTSSQRTDESSSSSFSEQSVTINNFQKECQTSFCTKEKQACKTSTSSLERNLENKGSYNELCHKLSVEINIDPMTGCVKQESKETHDIPSTRPQQQILSPLARKDYDRPLFRPEQRQPKTETPVQRDLRDNSCVKQVTKDYNDITQLSHPYSGTQEIRPSTAKRKFRDVMRHGETNQPTMYLTSSGHKDSVTETGEDKSELCNKLDKPINIKVEVTMELRPKGKGDKDKQKFEPRIESKIDRHCEKLISIKPDDCQSERDRDEDGYIDCADCLRRCDPRRKKKDTKRETKRAQSEMKRETRDAQSECITDKERKPERKPCKKCRCQNGLHRCKSKMDPSIDRCRRCCDCGMKKKVLSNAEKQMIFNVYENLLHETGKDLIEYPKKDDCCAEIAKEFGISKTCVCAVLEEKNTKETGTDEK